jgi:hypothetical protein
MDEERRTKIASALQQYRETVSQHNIILIRAVVQAVEALPVPPKCSESQAQQLRMRECSRVIGGAIPESATSPPHLVDDDDVLAEVIQRHHLDGVAHSPVNLEQREEYFAAIRTHIPENVELADFPPPPDLAYLCTLVSGIIGPGISYNHDAQQFAFISPIESRQQLKEMVEAVVVPIRNDGSGKPPQPSDFGVTYNQLTDIWADWEIAVAFKIGGGPRWGGSYALYCRREEDDHDEPLKWRYDVHDEDWQSDVYDSVEEFLGFYAHFKEQTVQEVKRGIRSLTGMRSR